MLYLRDSMRSAIQGVFVAFVVFVIAASAFGQQVKPGIPDVDKPGVPGDMSCWMAVASNMLGAAGYGLPAAGMPDTLQNRTDNIYTQLRNDLGFVNTGDPANALNYWLYAYGKNPSQPEYAPSIGYTDVTVGGWVDAPTYDFLLDELTRCQYVGVCFDAPTPGHCMTLVGGTKESLNPLASVSIWHDSDRDVGNGGGPDDDQYLNSFVNPNAPPGVMSLPGYPLFGANEWVTLCPGLNKPQNAVENYDVAWFKQDVDQNGSWAPGFRTAGDMDGFYTGPQGQTDPEWDPDPTVPELYLPNEIIPDWEKEIWLLVDYRDRDNAGDPGIVVRLPDGTTYSPDDYDYSDDNGQVLLHWILPVQPAWEVVVFPDVKYRNLTGDVKDWNIATVCVPEPASVLLLVFAGAMVLGRRR